MALLTGVRIVLEGTGDLLLETRWFHSIPQVNDFLYLSTDGGPETKYKVEKVGVHLASSTHTNVGGPLTKKSVQSTVVLTVSVVP